MIGMVSDNLFGFFSQSFYSLSSVVWIIVLLGMVLSFALWNNFSKRSFKFNKLSFLGKQPSMYTVQPPPNMSRIIDELDPIKEAKIFINYGKYDKAIQILKEQIKATPKAKEKAKEKKETSQIKKNKDKNLGSHQLASKDKIIDQNIAKWLNKKIDITQQNKSHIENFKSSAVKVVKSNKNIWLVNLSTLEKMIYFSFEGNCNVDKVLSQQKKSYQLDKKSFTQKASKKNIKLIKVKKQQDELPTKVKNTQQDILNEFQDIILSKKIKNAISFLESKIMQNPSLDKLYPVLIQSYIEFNLFKNYLNFRNSIFLHAIQPPIEITLLIIDAENRFIINKSEFKQVA